MFDVLAELIVAPGIVLDAGTGTGAIARGLVGRAAAIDALDASPRMLARARALPDGDHPSLSWILGRAEDRPLRSQYGLIVAASSLHWMDWPVVLRRFRDLLAPGAVLAIVDERASPNPWDGRLQALIDRFSTNRDFMPFTLITELGNRNLFRERGRCAAAPVLFRQSPAEYIESFHARNGFSRDRMEFLAAADFDRAVGRVIGPYLVAGNVQLTIAGDVIWGDPAPE